MRYRLLPCLNASVDRLPPVRGYIFSSGIAILNLLNSVFFFHNYSGQGNAALHGIPPVFFVKVHRDTASGATRKTKLRRNSNLRSEESDYFSPSRQHECFPIFVTVH